MKYLGAITDNDDLVNKKYVDDSIPTVPTKVSELTNDSGFITTETDPTVPSWAKANSKPSYTAGEVGALPISGGTITGNLGVNGTLTVGSHTSAIGSTVNGSLSAQKSVPASTSAGTMVASVSLPAGTWICVCGVRFAAGSSGVRVANLSTASGNGDYQISMTPTSANLNQMLFTKVITTTSTTTYYLNAMSSVATTVSAGGSGWGTFIQATRLV